jgi:hypothetical protein
MSLSTLSTGLLLIKDKKTARTDKYIYKIADSLSYWLRGGREYNRQSARLFLQLSELGLPHLLTRRRVCPPPSLLVRGGGGYTLACGRERGGGSQFRRGNRHFGTLGINMYLCGEVSMGKSANTWSAQEDPLGTQLNSSPKVPRGWQESPRPHRPNPRPHRPLARSCTMQKLRGGRHGKVVIKM